MKQLFSIVLLLAVCCVSGHCQQKHGAKSTFVESDGTYATFSVTVEADKKKNLESFAAEDLFYQIITKGVEGFEDGKPLMQNENKYWLNSIFFKQKDAPYKGFISSCRMEGEPQQTPSGTVQGTVKVTINRSALLRALRGYGVHE